MPSAQRYGDQSYWDARYISEPAKFEWYHDYSSLKSLILKFCTKHAPILHMGVGLSSLQDDMAADGFQDIISVDYSPVCIEQLKQWKHKPGCRFEVADVRSMPQFKDTSFQSIIDKGTLDSLLCGPSSFTEAHDALAEVHRVLKPGGNFIVVTYGMPKERLKHLHEHEWQVQTFTIQKRCVITSWFMWKDGRQQMLIEGPFVENANLRSLELVEDVNFVYVCSKPTQGASKVFTDSSAS